MKSTDATQPNISIPAVPARPPVSAHNSFDILTECDDDDDTVDEIPSVSGAEWPGLTTRISQTRRGWQVWSKGSQKKKEKLRSFSRELLQSHGRRSQELELLRVLMIVRKSIASVTREVGPA